MMKVTADQAAAGYMMFAAALRGDMRPRQANGQLASKRGGFGHYARDHGLCAKPYKPKVSKAAKAKCRAQAVSRKAHKRKVRR